VNWSPVLLLMLTVRSIILLTSIEDARRHAVFLVPFRGLMLALCSSQDEAMLLESFPVQTIPVLPSPSPPRVSV